MIIGNFIYGAAQDSYTGTIDTLTASVPAVTFRLIASRDAKAPDYRIEAQTSGGLVELGAAWKKRGAEGQGYLSVKLDGPTLLEPIHCALVSAIGQAGDFRLVWSRDLRRSSTMEA